MTLPSFATLKVLAPVALLAAVAGISTQVQAQVSVYHDGVDTDGLSGDVAKVLADTLTGLGVDKVVCPEPDGDSLKDTKIDFQQYPGSLSHFMFTHPPYEPAHQDVVWVSGGYGYLWVDPKFKKCVQGLRVSSKLIDSTGVPFCKKRVESTPRSETDTVAEPYKEDGRIIFYEYSADTYGQQLLVTYLGKEHYSPDDDSLPNPPSLGDSGQTVSECVRHASAVTVSVKSEFKDQSGKWVPFACWDFDRAVSYKPGFDPQYGNGTQPVHECAVPW